MKKLVVGLLAIVSVTCYAEYSSEINYGLANNEIQVELNEIESSHLDYLKSYICHLRSGGLNPQTMAIYLSAEDYADASSQCQSRATGGWRFSYVEEG